MIDETESGTISPTNEVHPKTNLLDLQKEGKITPELVRRVADKVYAMLKEELRLHNERQHRRGK